MPTQFNFGENGKSPSAQGCEGQNFSSVMWCQRASEPGPWNFISRKHIPVIAGKGLFALDIIVK